MGEPTKKPRVIKRYANRKLYDMSESCYITHDEIARLVKDGEEVRIIDNRTKEDLTTLTLTQILFKEEKKQRKTLPLNTLRGLLQSGGDFIQRTIAQPVAQLRDEAEETVGRVRSVFRPRHAEEGGEAPPGEEARERPREEPPRPAEPPPARTGEGFREWLESTQRAFENLQHSVEDRWDLMINALNHLDASRKRIKALEARVAELEARLGVTRDDDDGEPS